MGILIFENSQQLGEISSFPLNKEFEFKLWSPSFNNIIPPLLGMKYLYWWLAHYFGMFKSKDYSAILAYSNNVVIGIIVLTPAYSRWRFMEKNDLQITNVHVNPDYRGQGIAHKMINIAFGIFSKHGRTFWYITKDDNIASIKLCKKSGFKLAGKGFKRNRWLLKSFSVMTLVP